MNISVDQLVELGSTQENAELYIDYLNQTLDKYSINTPERVCHFLSQIYVESASLSKVREVLLYSAKRLTEVWPTRFPTIASTAGCVMNTDGLAARVYEGRTSLGNTQPGDGKRFLGRGLKQLTGRDNTTRCGRSLGVDFASNPELLEEPEYACLSAGWFWNVNKLNTQADKGGFAQVAVITRIVNGGDGGLKDRQRFYTRATEIFGE